MTKKTYLQSLIADMIRTAGSGHYASSMSALDVMYPLFYEQGVTPETFILSKGHAVPALYAILFDLGYLTADDLSKFRQYGGLSGHPSIQTPGVLCSSGSLGMGISKAIGLAHVNRDKTYHVLVGDGELQEGQNWEALYYLANSPLTNIHVHVDCNGHQYSGPTPGQPFIVGDARVSYHQTKWRHDNSYLTIPKEKDTTYSTALHTAMQADSRLITLNADLEHDFGLTIIKDSFPTRYIQCGISEQHMVSMAGGLARAGMIPICHTFGSFYRRAVDQIWNNMCDGLCVGYVAGLNDHGKVNIGDSHKETNIILVAMGLAEATNIEHFFKIVSNTNGGLLLEV